MVSIIFPKNKSHLCISLQSLKKITTFSFFCQRTHEALYKLLVVVLCPMCVSYELSE